MKLSIVCVTDAQPRAVPFITALAELAQLLGAEMIFGAHGPRATMLLDKHRTVEVNGRILEEMIDPVLDACSGEYVLRLDDDERCTDEMVEWLKAGGYTHYDSWFFPRFALWPDTSHLIVSSPFFPDFQQRLTTKEKAYRPHTIHAGSPHAAHRAPVAFEHHAFLVKTKEERRAITAKYESIVKGRHYETAEANIVAPEDWPNIVTAPVTSKLNDQAALHTWWRQHGVAPPAELERELQTWEEKRRGVTRVTF